jgi:hypothetical protein
MTDIFSPLPAKPPKTMINLPTLVAVCPYVAGTSSSNNEKKRRVN